MAIKQKILIVEDERSIVNFVSAILTANEYDVLLAYDGREAYAMITSHCPDAIILDLGLPDMDGIELIKLVREWSQMPIIVVSARSHERDKVEALDLGADDYITKPFGTSELLARIRMALRHAGTRGSNEQVLLEGIFQTGDLIIDYNKRQITVKGERVHLTQNEYRIVALLGRFAGRVLTYEFILKELWGPSASADNKILRVNMANIRRKLEENPAEPKHILTEVGVGYRMVD